MIKFALLSCGLWVTVFLVSIAPDKVRLTSLQARTLSLQSEIDKIEDNFKYLKAEREDLLENDRFYIRKLSREKLRLVLPPVKSETQEPLKR